MATRPPGLHTLRRLRRWVTARQGPALLFLTLQVLLFTLFFFHSRTEALSQLRDEHRNDVSWSAQWTRQRLDLYGDSEPGVRAAAEAAAEALEELGTPVDRLTFDSHTRGYDAQAAGRLLTALGPGGASSISRRNSR